VRLKVSLLIILVLMLFTWTASAQTATQSVSQIPTLLYKSLVGLEGVTPQRSEIFSEELRIALLRAGRFRLIEMDTTELSDAELLAERSGDFMLKGSISYQGNEYRFYIELTDKRNNTLLARAINTTEVTRDEDLKSLAEEVSLATSFSGEGADAWIQAYVDTKQWERAWTAWSRRAEVLPEEERTESFKVLGDLISSRLAEDRAVAARRLVAGGYYDLARSAADEAMALRPGDPMYSSLGREIEDFVTGRNEADLVLQLGVVENLLRNKEYQGALRLCRQLSEKGISDSRLDVVTEKAQSLKIEREAWESARDSYRKGDYDTAVTHIETALSYDPYYPEYHQFQERIRRQKKLKESTEKTVDDYRDRLATMDRRSMFIVRKDPEHIENLSIGIVNISGLNPADGFSERNLQFMVWDFSYTFYFQNLPDFLQFKNLVFGFRPTFIGSFRIGGEYNGSPISGVNPGYAESRIFFSEFGGTVGVSLQFYAFNLGTGFYFSLGGISLSDSKEFPTEPGLNTDTSGGAFILGTAWDLWLGWNSGERTEIRIRYRMGSYPVDADYLLRDPKWWDLTVGIGFKLW